MPKPRVMRLLQGYYFDKRNHNYIRAPTGRFVARGRIIELLEKSVAGRERRLFEGIRRLVDGTRSPQVFLSHAKVMLKRQYLQEAALAAGGWDQLTPADFGRVGGKLRAQYRRLSEMTAGVRDGEVSEAQALNRMQMYMGNARAEYFEVERERLPPVPQGQTRIERRRLGAKDKGNCDDCLRYDDMGWQPEGALPVPAQASLCNGNCRCDLRRMIVDAERATAAMGTKGRP